MHRSHKEQAMEGCEGSGGEWCSPCGDDQNHTCISYSVPLSGCQINRKNQGGSQ